MSATTFPWETVEDTASVPFDQTQIDVAFNAITTPAYMSSGWICSLTIECGTFICACR